MSERHRAKVYYSGGKTIVVKGPVTGSEYQFSGTNRWALLDPRDATVLSKIRPLFRIDGIVDIGVE